MPTQKDFKRLIRRRMQKTGESYTAARAQLLETRAAKTRAATPARASAPARKARPSTAGAPAAKPDYAKLAGMSDAAVEARTGCAWEKWVYVLDRVKAYEWPHRKIADYVHEKYRVPAWWTQTVTVGYERIRGLRAIGQRRGGSYEATKSRTFHVPVTSLFDAFASARKRSRWLPGIALEVRTATPPRSVRITWNDGTSVEVRLTAKGAGKSAAQIQHRKLPDKDAAARAKAFWSERLDALGKVLSA